LRPMGQGHGCVHFRRLDDWWPRNGRGGCLLEARTREWFVPCGVLSTPERLSAGSFMFYITITLCFCDCVFKKEGTAMKSYTKRQLTTWCGHLSVAYAFGVQKRDCCLYTLTWLVKSSDSKNTLVRTVAVG
jgi:hypothetical protein